MTRSGSWLRSSSAALPVGRLENLIALRGQAHSQELTNGRLVIDDQNLRRRGGHAAVSNFCGSVGIGSLIVNTAPVRSVRFAGDNRAVHGLDEAARNREAQPRPRAHVVGLPAPDRTCRRYAPDRRAESRRPRPRPASQPNPGLASSGCARSCRPAHTWPHCPRG